MSPQPIRRATFGGALIVLLACLSAGAVEAAELIGQVSRVQGQAVAHTAGAWRALLLLTPVYRGDRVSTGVGARLELVLADGTVLTLGANADLELDEFVYRPAGADNRLEVAVRGAFRFVSGKLKDSAARQARIRMPVATLGIRGTDVWGGPLDQAHGVFLLEGVVEVANAAGSVVLRNPGEGTDIAGPGTAPGPVVRWGQAKVDRAIATVSFQ